MENKNHEIPDHDDEKEGKKDHYHDKHHFDSLGNHDDINDEDFHWKNSLFTSRRNLTFRMTLTGVFLALAVALSAFEMLYEPFLENMGLPGGVAIPFRIIDLLVITLSLAALGPIFSSLIGFIVPFIHLVDGHHNPLSIVIDSLGYFSSIWIIWFIYYFIFKNSSIHKHPIKSIDRFKRWMPMVIYVPIMSLIYTLLVFLMIYLTTNYGHEHEDLLVGNISTYHGDHSANWSAVEENIGLFIGVILGIEILRFSLSYSLFAIIEPQIKKINHYYK